jgi:hypothetical protein
MYIGCAAATAGLGSLVSLTPLSSIGLQTGLQIPVGIGLGFVYISSTIAPQAILPNHLHSVAASHIMLMRVLGQAFGIAIGGTIFQNEFDKHVNIRLRDGSLSTNFIIRGTDAESAFERIGLFPPRVVDVYRFIYRDSLQIIWYTGMALAALALLSSFWTQKSSLNRGLTTNQRFVQKK